MISLIHQVKAIRGSRGMIAARKRKNPTLVLIGLSGEIVGTEVKVFSVILNVSVIYRVNISVSVLDLKN